MKVTVEDKFSPFELSELRSSVRMDRPDCRVLVLSYGFELNFKY
jgi:hypothetical protein